MRKKKLVETGLAMSLAAGGLLGTAAVWPLPLRVVVDNERVVFPDAQPYVDEQNRTQVPVRFVGEALGAKVSWDGEKRQAVFEKGPRRVVLTIGQRAYEVDGQEKEMDTEAVLARGRTYVPARYVAEALGAEVEWDVRVRTVYIWTGKVVKPAKEAEEGEVRYYDGIAFNPATDTDEYGRIEVEKAKEFTVNMARYLKFVKEGGKYYIKGSYPEIPEGYEWWLIISVYFKDRNKPIEDYHPESAFPENIIPREGSFVREIPMKDPSELDGINIGIFINVKDKSKLPCVTTENGVGCKNPYTGLFNIVYFWDVKRANFVSDLTNFVGEEDFTNRFPFEEMFQW